MSRCKGLDLFSLVSFLEKHDKSEFRNLIGDEGIPLSFNSLLNQNSRMRQRVNPSGDNYVLNNCGELVPASQPRSAKRA